MTDLVKMTKEILGQEDCPTDEQQNFITYRHPDNSITIIKDQAQLTFTAREVRDMIVELQSYELSDAHERGEIG